MGAVFNSKIATKRFQCPYLGDYLSYRLEICYKDSLYPKDKIDKFWTPDSAAFNSKKAAKIFHCPYLRLEIWYKDSFYPKDKSDKFWTPGGAAV